MTLQTHDIAELGLSNSAEREIVDLCDASKALLAYRLVGGARSEFGYRQMIAGAKQIYSGGECDAYLYRDGSVVYDRANGYESAPDVDSMMDATGWERDDLSL